MKARKKSRSRLENWDEMTEFLALVSKPEIRWKNSHARLEARDWKKEILELVSKHEIERKKISISSRSVRPEERNSRSRLGHEIERQIFSIPSRKLKQGSRWTLNPTYSLLVYPYPILERLPYLFVFSTLQETCLSQYRINFSWLS